jgi:hypothetical protein
MSQNRFGIFDKVTIATIVGAGALQALQQALKDADRVKAALPALNLDGAWNYVPLVLLIVGGLSWLTKQLMTQAYQNGWASVAPSAPATAHKSDKRDFLPDEVNLARLRELTAGLTVAQASRVLEPYVDKWMRVSGAVYDVKFYETDRAMLLLRAPGEDWIGTLTPPLIFSRQAWEDTLHDLKKGDEATVHGRVVVAAGETIMLVDSELMSPVPLKT